MILTVEEIKAKLTPVFEQNGVTKAILFGSYAKGEATENSDVDIVIGLDPDVRALKYFGVLEDIVEVLDKEIDMIPLKSIIPNERVDIEVAKSGLVIYERT